MTKQLSPAVLAVWEAFNQDEAGVFVDYGDKLAAALRAAASQLLAVQWEGQIQPDAVRILGINWACDALHTIANELEAH